MHFSQRIKYLLWSLFPAIITIAILLNNINSTTLLAATEAITATTITVNTTDDELNSDGDCSLREAVQAANSDSPVDGCSAGDGTDTIILPAGTYSLTLAGSDDDTNATGDLDVQASLTISGAGDNLTTIDGFNLDRVIHVTSTVTDTLAFQLEGVAVTNGSSGNGAGIYLSNSTARFIDVNINANTAITNGGGIYINNSLVLIEGDSKVSANTAADGAGIYADRDGQLQIKDSIIEYNNASDDGGAGYLLASNVTAHNTTIQYNQAGRHAAGFFTDRTVRLQDSQVQFNQAVDEGGGLLVDGRGVIFVENSIFYSNTASYGGGISQDDEGNIYIVDSIFRDNSASSDGGGVYLYEEGGVIVEGSLFEGNQASDGGAIHIESYGSLSIDNSTFISNTAVVDGGAINTSEGDYTYTYIRNSTLAYNTAGEEGGAVYSYFLGVAFENSTVVSNTAGTRGGGFANPDYFGYFYNTIMAGNSANGSTSDEYADCYAPSYTLHTAGNNLFGPSTGCQESRYDLTLPVDTIFTTVLEPLADNGGHVLPDGTHPPSFALKSGSIAIDAGNDDFCPLADQVGTARANGNACDLGAVESNETATPPVFTDNVITVDTFLDDETVNGNCTLREAVQSAESNTAVDACTAGDRWDVITLPAGTYSVTIDHIRVVSEHVTIRGASTESTIIDGNNATQVLFTQDDGGLFLEDLTVANGKDDSDGGCIEASSYGFAILVDVVVKDCEARDGGGIEVYGHLNLIRTTIENSVSDRYAGGLYNYYGLTFLTDSTITGNTSLDSYAGGVYNEYGHFRMSNSDISHNRTISSARGYAGGLNSYVANTIIENGSTIQYNDAATDCGGILGEYSAIWIRDSVISHNSTAGSGGGICGDEEGIWLQNSVVEHNTAAINGGGIFGAALVENSTIRYNEANSGLGGGAFAGGTVPTGPSGRTRPTGLGLIVETSSIYGNSAGYGGGLAVDGSVTLHHVTVSENSAVTSTGGISMTENASFIMANSIVANSTGEDCAVSGEYIDDGYNLVGSGACLAADSSLSGDPQLTSMASIITGEVTLVPMTGSLVIDAIPDGVNGCGTTYTTDQLGVDRPQGFGCDIGAVEGDTILTLTTTIVGNGAVSSAFAGINCVDSCESPLSYGTVVTLTATAAEGSSFTGWSGACSGTDLSCVITMDTAQMVTATFDLASYTNFLPLVIQP